MTDINLDGIATWLSDWFQEKLVSGTNLKTINNQSLLGDGNLSISGDISDTGWQNATMESGWTAYDTGSTLKYRRYGKVVEVKGIIKVTATKSGTSFVVATISDTTCRPNNTRRYYNTGLSNYHFVTSIASDGKITIDRHYNGTTSQSSATTSMVFTIEATYLVD